MISVSIIGFGNVGQHLFKALSALEGIHITQVFDRSNAFTVKDGVVFVSTLEALSPADINILAVKDDAISEVSEKLPYQGSLVVHTSGSAPLDAIDSKNRSGVFYMLQSFSKDAKVDFSKIPICIEAERENDLKLLEKLGEMLSHSVQEIHSENRKKLHLAATWVNNFSNHLFHLAADYLESHQLSFDLLKPLILETALKIQELHPSKAQTGPAIRRDEKTVERHLRLLNDRQLQEIYKLFTESIQNKNQ